MVNRIRLGADLVALVGFGIGAFISLSAIDSRTYWFPAFVMVSGSLAAAYLLISDAVRLRAGESLVAAEVTDLGASLSDTRDRDEAGDDAGDGADRTGGIGKRVIAWSLWLAALPLLALVVPFFYASLAWLLAVLLLQAKRNWKFVVPAVVVFGVFLNIIVVALDIGLPPAFLTGLG